MLEPPLLYVEIDVIVSEMNNQQLSDEVEQNDVICKWQADRLREIINLQDTDKSRYFAITEFNNCFIIRSPSSFFSVFSGSVAISHFHARAVTRRRKA